MSRISCSGKVLRSTPLKWTSPAAETPGGNSRAIAFAVNDLPEPDSPTMAIDSPRCRSRSIPVVMTRRPAETARPRTDSNALCPEDKPLPPQPFEQPVADQVHADRGQDDRCCRNEQRHGIG